MYGDDWSKRAESGGVLTPLGGLTSRLICCSGLGSKTSGSGMGLGALGFSAVFKGTRDEMLRVPSEEDTRVSIEGVVFF